jgi:O-antigen/teichoic acid export membrane protein
MVANLLGQLVFLVLSVIGVKLLFGHFGLDALGVVLFSQTLNLVLVGVLELGISSVTVREIASQLDRDPVYVRNLMRTASSFYWLAFLLPAAALAGAAGLITSHWIHLRVMNAETAAMVLRILGIAALTAIPRALYVSVLRGLQRMTLSNGIDVGLGLTQQIGIVVILTRGGDLTAVVTWLAATYLASLATYAVAVTRYIDWRALVPGWSLAVVRRNLRFSAHMTVISAIGIIHTYLDKLVVSALLPIATLGSYGFASSIVARGAVVTAALGDAAYPSLSSLADRDRVGLLARYQKLQELVCFGTIPVFGAIALLSTPLLRTVFGPAMAQALLLPVVVLCLGYYLNGTLTMPYLHSLAVGKPEITSRLSLAALLLVVPVTVACVAIMGVSGAAFGYLAYHVFFYIVGVPRFCRECLRIRVMAWYQPVWRAGLLAIGTYGVAGLALGWLRLDGWPPTVALTAAATLIFAALAYRLIDPALRESIKGLGRGQVPGVMPRAA